VQKPDSLFLFETEHIVMDELGKEKEC